MGRGAKQGASPRRGAAIAAVALLLAAPLAACSQPSGSAKLSAPSPTAPTATSEAASPTAPARAGLAAADATPATSEPPSQPSVERRKVAAGGMEREFILSLPQGAHQRKRLPLILVFHGYLEDPEGIRRDSEMDKADAVVAYLQGVGKAWAPAPYATTTGEQDLAFVDAVRSQLSGEFGIDRSRVFAAGFSNGGGFADFVGCQRPQDFTAVATVSAAIYDRVDDGCSTIPMKQIDFHGTADPVINYAGGVRHDTVYESALEMTEEAAARNRCSTDPDERRVGNHVVAQQWQDCDAEFEHFRVEGGPHVWPGGLSDSSGTAAKGFATQQILDFFDVKQR